MTKSIKKDLQVFWDTIDPGNIVTHSSPAIKVIRELGLHEVRVKNDDKTKFDKKRSEILHYGNMLKADNLQTATFRLQTATFQMQLRKISKPEKHPSLNHKSLVAEVHLHQITLRPPWLRLL